MTKEEKQLLLKDLCARLPYRVNILSDIDKEFDGGLIGVLYRIEPYIGEEHPKYKGQFLLYQEGVYTPYLVDEVKPYLRPMSSMTKKEKKYISERCGFSIAGPIRNECELIMSVLTADWLINFYNEHHFDYRGLIEKGLALEAPEDMYKTE